MIRSFQGRAPQIHPSAYVDPQAVIIGDVAIGEDSSIWPCAVLRGDYHSIRIGADQHPGWLRDPHSRREFFGVRGR